MDNLTPQEEFLTQLEIFIAQIDSIDKKVPWQITEPEWWLKMMNLRKVCRQTATCLELAKQKS